jgi:hypothetical protein
LGSLGGRFETEILRDVFDQLLLYLFAKKEPTLAAAQSKPVTAQFFLNREQKITACGIEIRLTSSWKLDCIAVDSR